MAEDLSKLTVAQLKALCKEKKITGYSKLGKNALLQKLAEAGSGHGQPPSNATIQDSRAKSGQTVPNTSLASDNFCQEQPLNGASPATSALPPTASASTSASLQAAFAQDGRSRSTSQIMQQASTRQPQVSPAQDVASMPVGPPLADSVNHSSSRSLVPSSSANIPKGMKRTNPSARMGPPTAKKPRSDSLKPGNAQGGSLQSSVSKVPTGTSPSVASQGSSILQAQTSHGGTPAATSALPPTVSPATSVDLRTPRAEDGQARRQLSARTQASHIAQQDSSRQPQIPAAQNASSVVSQEAHPSVAQSVSHMPSRSLVSSTSANIPKGKKRSKPSAQMGPPAAKKPRHDNLKPAQRGSLQSSVPNVLTGSSSSSASQYPLVTQAQAPPISSALISGSRPLLPSSASRGIPNTVTAVSTAASGKRFKPLVIKKPPQASAGVTRSTLPAQKTRPSASKEPGVLSVLDFGPPPPMPVLGPINFPPTISQRKRVHQWAIILSGLDNAGRRACVLVSKMIRYAVYLSAGHILKREFGGKRLEAVTKRNPPAMTNLWPYLRVREEERSARITSYSSSFMSATLEGRPAPIHRRLWGSPDHDKQAIIAARSTITRLCFALHARTEAKMDWTNEVVIDAQEHVPGEVWSVTAAPNEDVAFGNLTRAETVYILEATCEVIGRPPQQHQPGPGQPNMTSLKLRADWSSHIQRHLTAPGSPSLLSQLKWPNHEEYDQGISKLWLRRISSEGDIGITKRTVAFRYVLACVVANSVSGEWRSASEMAQDFAGLPSRHARLQKTAESGPSVNLYLPEHHLVESVHFVTPGGKPLHEALATVQTPRREYYVLKDNGFEVGCEEEGVANVWMETLRCCSRGLAL